MAHLRIRLCCICSGREPKERAIFIDGLSCLQTRKLKPTEEKAYEGTQGNGLKIWIRRCLSGWKPPPLGCEVRERGYTFWLLHVFRWHLGATWWFPATLPSLDRSRVQSWTVFLLLWGRSFILQETSPRVSMAAVSFDSPWGFTACCSSLNLPFHIYCTSPLLKISRGTMERGGVETDSALDSPFDLQSWDTENLSGTVLLYEILP